MFPVSVRADTAPIRVAKGESMAKPAVIIVGADKGGVGKTTVSRTLLDYFIAHNIPTRAFDTEAPQGHAQALPSGHHRGRRHHSIARSDEDLRHASSAEAQITVIDVRAGLLSPTLQALRDIGFIEAAKKGQITFAVFHILGPSIASLDEIAETAAFLSDANYFLVKNFINNTHFFEWDQATYDSYFKKSRTPSRSPFRSSTRWPASRSSWPRCRS